MCPTKYKALLIPNFKREKHLLFRYNRLKTMSSYFVLQKNENLFKLAHQQQQGLFKSPTVLVKQKERE